MLDSFLKNFIPQDGERFIFFENGKPVFVIMSYDDYQKKIKKNTTKESEENSDDENSEENTLTIDDLPI